MTVARIIYPIGKTESFTQCLALDDFKVIDEALKEVSIKNEPRLFLSGEVVFLAKNYKHAEEIRELILAKEREIVGVYDPEDPLVKFVQEARNPANYLVGSFTKVEGSYNFVVKLGDNLQGGVHGSDFFALADLIKRLAAGQYDNNDLQTFKWFKTMIKVYPDEKRVVVNDKVVFSLTKDPFGDIAAKFKEVAVYNGNDFVPVEGPIEFGDENGISFKRGKRLCVRYDGKGVNGMWKLIVRLTDIDGQLWFINFAETHV